MRRLAVFFAIGLLASSVAVGCSSDTGSSSNGEDGWTADGQNGGNDTGEEPNDTSEEPDTGADEDTTIPDTVADTGDDEEDGGLTDASDTGDGPEDTSSYPDGDASDVDLLPDDFGPGSFLRHFYIDDKESERSQTDGRCCYDFESGQFGNGTENDNAIADLITEGGSAVGLDLNSVNASINQRIEAGLLIYLFEYGDWSMSNWENDSSIVLNVLKGRDADSDFQDNLDGDGSFLVTRSSYASNGQPKWHFNSASTQNGVLRASGGNVVLQLQLLFGITLRLRLLDPQLKATVDSSNLDLQSGGTVALTDGKLAGKIPKADIYDGINNAVATCGCLGGQDLLTDMNDDDSYQCTSKQGSCNCPQRLENVIDNCSLIQLGVASYQDYDTNNTPGDDALSVGASFDAVGAEITGTTQ